MTARASELVSFVTRDGARLSAILTAAEELYGAPIRLESVVDARWKRLTAFSRVAADGSGVIYYRRRDLVSFQVHCVFHELGHLLLGGGECSLTDQRPASSPGLGRLLGRGRRALSDPGELAVEEFAHQLMRRLLTIELTAEEQVLG